MKLTESQDKSKNSIQESDNKKLLIASLLMAYKRTGFEPRSEDELNVIMQDVETEFKGKMKLSDVISSVKKGALGYYGHTYKMTSQTVCTWIREGYKSTDEYKKEQRLKLL